MQKQIDVGFLKVSNWLEWVATIVLTPKRDEKVRMQSVPDTLIRLTLKMILLFLE